MLDAIQTASSQTNVKVSAKAQQEAPIGMESQSQEIDFEDVLDILNPLQHIPVVSNIYQEHSQDEISDDAKAVGDILYGILTGGVFGVFSAIGNAILKQQTEKDLGEHVMAFFDDDNEEIAMSDNALEDNAVIHNGPQQQPQAVSQNDDYWSLRMKQIFGDDDFG